MADTKEAIKKYSFSLWPGYLGLQVVLFIVHFAFKTEMPWYILWFPSLLVGGIIGGIIAIVIVLGIIAAIWIMYCVINYEKLKKIYEGIKEKRMMKKMCKGDEYIEYVNKITGVK